MTDTAGVLSMEEHTRLSALLKGYHTETHHQIAILTIPSLNGEPLEQFSLRVANTWGLGYRGVDNGILITLAMQDRKVRIELGRGMEPYISNAQAEAVINETMVPEFRQGDFAGGLEAGLKQLMAYARRFVVRPQ
ncbi:MAG: TPM domain-containing protein [Proteobacteria bacterium]|nr:TPM domain-containing protein [Pseudomonadota bacterium]